MSNAVEPPWIAVHDGQGQPAPIFLPCDCPIGRRTKKATEAAWGLGCSVAVAAVAAQTNSVAKLAAPEEKIIIIMKTVTARYIYTNVVYIREKSRTLRPFPASEILPFLLRGLP